MDVPRWYPRIVYAPILADRDLGRRGIIARIQVPFTLAQVGNANDTGPLRDFGFDGNIGVLCVALTTP